MAFDPITGQPIPAGVIPVNQAGTVSEVTFLTVSQFKHETGANSFEVLRNPKTGKLFMASDSGVNYKVQGDIDPSKEMKMLVPIEGLSEACLVNVSPGAELQFTL